MNVYGIYLSSKHCIFRKDQLFPVTVVIVALTGKTDYGDLGSKYLSCLFRCFFNPCGFKYYKRIGFQFNCCCHRRVLHGKFINLTPGEECEGYAFE